MRRAGDRQHAVEEGHANVRHLGDGAADRIGGLVLPWFAPDRGRATLRIVGEGLKLDVPLSLQPPPAAS